MFGNLAAQYDVRFAANVGTFRADMEQVRIAAREGYGGISTAALKASAVEEKYERALARTKIGSYQANRATLAYRKEVEALNLEQSRFGRGGGGLSLGGGSSALKNEERRAGSFLRGGVASTGLFGRAATFASSAFLGGVGLAFAAKTVIGAAEDEQVALGHLQIAVKNAGLSWRTYGTQLEAAATKQEHASGFQKADISEALAKNVTRYGDVTKAIQATAAAEDIARQKGISLADAQSIMQRASFGTARSARQLGIAFTASTDNVDKLKETTKHYTSEQLAAAKAADQQANRTALLAAIEQKYHGAAARYLQTTAGKQQLLNAELKDTEALIGQALLPTFNHYIGSLTSWLSKAKNQKTIQHDVNTAVHVGVLGVRLLAGAFKTAEAVLKPFASLVGGFPHLFEAAFGAKLLLSLSKTALGAQAVSAAMTAIGTSAVAATAEADTALDGMAATAKTDAAIVGTAAGGETLPVGGGGSKIPGKGTRGLSFRGIPLGGPLIVATEVLSTSGDAPNVSDLVPGSDAAKIAALATSGKIPESVLKAAGKAAGLDPDTPAGNALTNTKVLQYLENYAVAHGLAYLKGKKSAKPLGSKTDNGFGTADLSGTGSGSGKGKGDGSGYMVTGVALLNQNLNEALASGNQAAIKKAAQDKLNYDIAAAAFAKKRLASGKGSPGLYAQYQTVLSDEASQRSTIASVASSSTSAANKAESAHARAVAAQRQQLANKLSAAGLAGGHPRKVPLFTAEGPSFYAAAYAHNKAFAKPGPYQTVLTAAQERAFRKWVKDNHVPFDPDEKTPDYDMRGYWLAMIHGHAPKWAGGKTHFPDTYKTPYDTTFSGESKYAKKGTPFVWKGDNLVDTRTGQVIFGTAPATSESSAAAKLLAFDTRESHDTSLTDSQRAQYAKKAIGDRAKATAITKKHRKALIASLEQIPDNLKAAVLLAKGAAQEKVALEAELAQVNQQLATLKKIHAGKAAIEKTRLLAAGIQHRINSLSKDTKNGGPGGNETQFLSSFAEITSKYAPNAFPRPGKAETHLYELVHETRRTNAHLAAIVKRTVNPGTARVILSNGAVGA